jgi:hypothetical protein
MPIEVTITDPLLQFAVPISVVLLVERRPETEDRVVDEPPRQESPVSPSRDRSG